MAKVETIIRRMLREIGPFDEEMASTVWIQKVFDQLHLLEISSVATCGIYKIRYNLFPVTLTPPTGYRSPRRLVYRK